jgi:cytochrome bd-type quinol oxidase subunit 2
LVLLIVQAYFVLRLTFSDEEKRTMFSAAYCSGSLIPNLVLIFVLPRLPQMMSFHPSDTLSGGKLDGLHWSVVVLVFVSIALISAWAYRLRVKADLLETQLETTTYGDSDDSRDPSAPTGVVRPLSVSDSSEPEN